MTNAIAVAHGTAVTIASASGASIITNGVDTEVLTDGRYAVTYGMSTLVQWGTPPLGAALSDYDVFAKVLDVDGNGAAAFEVPATPDPALPPEGPSSGPSPLLQQINPDVTATADGGFAISWRQTTAAGLPTNELRIFDAAGAGGSDLFVNTFDNQLGAAPAIASLADGRVAAVYEKFIAGFEFKTNLVGRIAAPDGTVSDEIPVSNGYSFGLGYTGFAPAEMLPLADGGFYAVITRIDTQAAFRLRTITAYEYSSAGVLEQQISIVSTLQFSGGVSSDAELLSDGGLAVVYTGFDSSIGSERLWLQIRDAAGVTTSIEVANAATVSLVDLAVLSDGRFAVAWADSGETIVRIVAADGSGGPAIAVAAVAFDTLQIEALPQGRFVMTTSNAGEVTSQVFDAVEGPQITTTSLTLVENTTVAGTVSADAALGGALSYSLAASTSANDNALFAIDPQTGQLSFLAAPDFENPKDLGSAPFDNVYNVQAIVTEIGAGSRTSALTVTVTDQQNIISGDTGDNQTALGDTDVAGTGKEDTLFGLAGDDRLVGGNGDDILDGGPGGDILEGGSGFDAASYADALGPVVASLILGGGISGDGLGDTYSSIENLTGSDFNDYLVGDNGDNVVKGGDGYDVIYGLDGNNTLIGGDKDDIYVSTTTNGTDTIVEKPGEGLDTVYSNHAFTLTAGVEQLVLFGLAPSGTGDDNANTIAGNTDAGIEIDGRGGNDVIFGSTFADTLLGGDGDDVIIGVGGGDVFDGGAGHDVYVSISSLDTFVDAGDGSDGFDTLFVNRNYTNTSMIDQVIMTGAALTLTGSDANEVLVGSNVAFVTIDGKGGNDVIFGSAYGDVLTGGAGYDALIGYGGSDVFAFHADSGVDTIYDFEPASGGAAHDFIAFYRPVLPSSDPVITEVNLGGVISAQVSYDGSFITLYGVHAADLGAGDFLFMQEPLP